MARATARREVETVRSGLPTITSRDSVPPRTAAFATGSHHDLFAEAHTTRCDVCNVVLDPKSAEERGTGVYIWARGDEVRREEVPLCASCGGAVFASALGMFDYGDEE
jgi:hypothetical protein